VFSRKFIHIKIYGFSLTKIYETELLKNFRREGEKNNEITSHINPHCNLKLVEFCLVFSWLPSSRHLPK
jgi:hypothetical protein